MVASDPSFEKIVVQVSDGRVSSSIAALRNTENILKETKSGKINLEVRIVVFGDALKNFTKKDSKDMSKLVQSLRTNSNSNIKFFACENSLKRLKLSATDLLEDFELVPSGAWETVRLQKVGFTYFHP